jgi:Endodeoxyribonuclease RusA
MIAFSHVLTLMTLGTTVCATVDAYLFSARGPVSFYKHRNFFCNLRRWRSMRRSTKRYGAKTDTTEFTTEGKIAKGKRKTRSIEKKQDKTVSTFLDEGAPPKNISSFDRNVLVQVEALMEPASAPLTKGKKSKLRNSSQVHIEPSHWIVPSDDIIFREMIERSDEHSSKRIVPSVLRFTVRGNPLPLRRHRTSRGFVYNPSAATQKSFRAIVERTLATHVIHRDRATDERGLPWNIGSNNRTVLIDIDKTPVDNRIPLWNSLQPIAVSIVFRMKRPKSHFIANRPGVDRLRKLAPRHMCATSMRTDVDNLAKFVLDSLNGLVYADDRQIVSLHVTKLYDNDDTESLYQGSTCVCIRLLQDDNIPQLLSTAMNMFKSDDIDWLN